MARYIQTLVTDGAAPARQSFPKVDWPSMNRYRFTSSLTGFLIALGFWIFDSSIHHFVYGEEKFEFIPEDFNELWMRIVIVLLIVCFGIYSDYVSNRQIKREKELEALQVYNSMVNATHHILNNLLNQMQLIRLEAAKCKDFKQERVKQFDSAIDEAVGLIEKLSSIKQVTDENIRASVNNGKSAR